MRPKGCAPSITSPRSTGPPDSYYHDVNVAGTENVLIAAQQHGVERTVHCSTIGVHGDVKEIPCREESPYNPGDIYQITKLDGELKAQEAFAAGLPGTIFRPAGIYGPGDTRFLKLFKTIRQGTFRMFGSGEIQFHPVFIDDLTEGIILCGEHPAAVGNIYILAGEESETLNAFVRHIAQGLNCKPPRMHLPLWPLLAAATACEALCKPIGLEPPLHRRRVAFFMKARSFTIDKAKREISFQPKVDIADGARRTAQWYFEQGYLN